MTPFKTFIGLESTLLLAIEKSKTEFVASAIAQGYTEEESGSAWHSLRTSSKGQKLTTRMATTKSRVPSSGGEQIEVVREEKSNRIIATSVVSKEEIALEKQEEKAAAAGGKKKGKQAPTPVVVEEEIGDTLPPVEEKSKKKEKVKKEKAPAEPKEELAPSDDTAKPDRMTQVKALYEGGMTSPAAIAKETGINPSYVFTLIKKIKAALAEKAS